MCDGDSVDQSSLPFFLQDSQVQLQTLLLLVQQQYFPQENQFGWLSLSIMFVLDCDVCVGDHKQEWQAVFPQLLIPQKLIQSVLQYYQGNQTQGHFQMLTCFEFPSIHL